MISKYHIPSVRHFLLHPSSLSSSLWKEKYFQEHYKSEFHTTCHHCSLTQLTDYPRWQATDQLHTLCWFQQTKLQFTTLSQMGSLHLLSSMHYIADMVSYYRWFFLAAWLHSSQQIVQCLLIVCVWDELNDTWYFGNGLFNWYKLSTKIYVIISNLV